MEADTTGVDWRRQGPRAIGLVALYGAIAWAGWGGQSMTVAWGTATVVLAALLIVLSLHDLETMRLPDVLTGALLVAGMLLAGLNGGSEFLVKVAGALAGFAVLYTVAALYQWRSGRAGLGRGDAKLLGAGGAWIGIEALPTALLVATFAALAVVGALSLTGREVTRHTRIAFGPFLALGIWVEWTLGPLL